MQGKNRSPNSNNATPRRKIDLKVQQISTKNNALETHRSIQNKNRQLEFEKIHKAIQSYDEMNMPTSPLRNQRYHKAQLPELATTSNQEDEL